MHDSSDATSDAFRYLITSGVTGKLQAIRLQPGHVATIGRSSTNRIVLNDDICSRNHCELFWSSEGWMLRDRDSRNGTLVNETRVKQDHLLDVGDVIRIGNTLLVFSDSESTEPDPPQPPSSEQDTATELRITDEIRNTAEILATQHKTSYKDDLPTDNQQQNPQEIARLSRLINMSIKLAAATTPQQLGDLVLDSLVGITGADIGAVLAHSDYEEIQSPQTISLEELVITSYRSLAGGQYRRISNTLSTRVLTSGDAILGLDVSADTNLLPSRDSLDDIEARSLVVAPIRSGSKRFGLIHLYSTNIENRLDAAALDYTLAVADQFAVALNNLHDRQTVRANYERELSDRSRAQQDRQIASELVGVSPAMQQLRDTIALVAPADAVVLIRGESGVGKELVARAIHQNSRRSDHALVCMNCAALSESLLESELFGHEKGSFTGATSQKAGKFEQADAGTLFLDEVGEMSPSIQAKFLRVMEGHPFERVGGAQPIKVDVRIVAATNRNLEQAVRDLKFRKDLYFRLQVLEIHVPPLRQRAEDIPLLAEFFATRVATKADRPTPQFTQQAKLKLIQYNWPGNVRELQNTIERAVVLSNFETVDLPHIRLSTLDQPQDPTSAVHSIPDESAQYSELSIEDIEKRHILQTLEMTGGNKSKAAQILRIERSTLDRKLKKYGRKPGKST